MNSYLTLARHIANNVTRRLVQHLSENGYQGIQSENPGESKATHQVDKIAAEEILKVTRELPCDLYMESFEEIHKSNSTFTIFIDPVDGSINWDRGIGDAGICIALSDVKGEVYYRDLNFVYIQGFRTGDVYYFENGKAWYENNLTGKKWPLKLLKPVPLHNAMGYLKTGYGGARRQLEKTLPLFYLCKDIRSFDNSAMELAELSRGATDFIIDSRDLSDSFNLLAYPLIKHVGGVITDLSGEDIGNCKITPGDIINFVAAGSLSLHQEVLSEMSS